MVQPVKQQSENTPLCVHVFAHNKDLQHVCVEMVTFAQALEAWKHNKILIGAHQHLALRSYIEFFL